MEMAHGVTAQQMVWSYNMEIEIVHKGTHTPPFAVTSHHLPYAIWTTILKLIALFQNFFPNGKW